MQWNLSESHFNEKWANLSGGEMQRCALAVAVAFHPEVLLLDGPCAQTSISFRDRDADTFHFVYAL